MATLQLAQSTKVSDLLTFDSPNCSSNHSDWKHEQYNTKLTIKTRTLVIIDTRVNDYQFLANGIVEGAEVFILDADSDGIHQITSILENLNVKNQERLSIHILSHGSPGTLYLGNTKLNLETLQLYRNEIRQWFQNSCSPDFLLNKRRGELLLYGCNVAYGQIGKQFTSRLSEVTTAAIAASTNPTGNRDLGGDWNLEFKTHVIDSSLALKSEVLATYPAILPQINIGDLAPNVEMESFEGIVVGTNVGTSSFGDGYIVPGNVSNYTFSSGAVTLTSPIPNNENRVLSGDFARGSATWNLPGNGTVQNSDVPDGTAYLGYNNSSGFYELTFANPVLQAGALVDSDGNTTLQAFDRNNNLIDTAVISDTPVASWKNNFLGVENLAGIKTVRISGDFTVLDKLSFQPNSLPIAGTAITSTSTEGDSIFNINLLQGSSDPDGAPINVGNLSLMGGNDTGITMMGNSLSINPSAYSFLDLGESEVITYSYDISDGIDSVSQTATITVNGDGLEFATPINVGSRGPIQNKIRGTDDRDKLRGTNNNDRILGRGDNDKMQGRDGDDVMKGGFGDDIMKGGDGNDKLSGQSGNNRLLGQNNDDLLIGGNEGDILKGGKGNDILVGKQGDDILIGGSGQDTYRYRRLNEGSDTIKGFNVSEDVIDFSKILKQAQYQTISLEQQFNQFIKIEQVGSNTEVSIDEDGIGASTNFETLAILRGTIANTVKSTNFVVI